MNKIFIIGATLVLIGAVLPIFQIRLDEIQVAPFVFSLGVAGVLVGRYIQPIRGDELRIKRLRFQQFISSFALAASACLMFIEDKRWVLALFVAAVIDLVISYRMPQKEK
ncbi:MAG: hypothetical protein LBR52_03035 [Prevotellaceae bacterium]|jgi:hypothetical protein|nr:hypothetical protein [Prevotellaceae bacterium]